MAEHALTGHKVAIKILNRKKIKAMDMDEKGAPPRPRAARAPPRRAAARVPTRARRAVSATPV
jgi:hypothetical protein